MKFNNINLGITSKCNAKCKYCNRHTFNGFGDINKDMSLNTFKKIYPYTKHIEFCGSYGDFINHKNGLEFLLISKHHNVNFNVETNAGIRDKEYWVELASICNSEKYYVQFSIDDIDNDVNPYRGVNTNTVLNNLKTFIDAGGYATVKTILFKFNENQNMEQFFYHLGVKNYLRQYSMVYEQGILSSPSDCKYKNGTLDFLYKTSKYIKSPPKKCPWFNGRWLYIFDNGELHQCCNLVIHSVDLIDTLPVVGKYTDKYEY